LPLTVFKPEVVSFSAPELRAWRLLRNLSQSGLAKRMSVSKQYIWDIENGRRRVNKDFVERFKKVFKL